MVGLPPARPGQPPPQVLPAKPAAPPAPPPRPIRRHDTLEDVVLGEIVPGARVADVSAAAFELPIDDDSERDEAARRALPRTPLFYSLAEPQLATFIEAVRLEELE